MTGIWISEKSEITGYSPGSEYIIFNPNGDHIWAIGDHGKITWRCVFNLHKKSLMNYQFIPKDNATGFAKENGWMVLIEIFKNKILMTGPHGYKTTFVEAGNNAKGIAALFVDSQPSLKSKRAEDVRP